MHKTTLVLLVALTLLGGCLSSKDGSPGTGSSPGASTGPTSGADLTLATPTPLAPVLVGSPGAAEPNIAVAPDGTLYVSNPGQVWHSTDAGKSWSGATSVDGGGDGDIAVDGSGTAYYLGLFGDAGPVPFSASSDGGKSFGKAVDLSSPAFKTTDGTGVDREWIDATPDGHLYTTWRGSPGGKSALEFRASMDGGATWQDKSVVGADGDEGPVVHDAASGMLYVPVVDLADTVAADTVGAAVHVYTSTDQGASWGEHITNTLPRDSPVEPNGYASDFPVVSVDAAGNAYLVYSAPLRLPAAAPDVTLPEEANLFAIYLQASTDHGESWSAPRLLSANNKDARMPWIAAGANGRIAIVWYENVVGNPGEMLPDEWNVKLWESLDATNPAGQAVTVTLTPTPNHVGSLCTSGTGCAAGGDRSLLDYFEVAIDNQGQPVVAWAASTLGTGIGLAVQGTDIYFGGATGTPLK